MAGILPGGQNRKLLMVCHSRRCRIFFMGVCGRQTFSGQYRVCKRQYSLLAKERYLTLMEENPELLQDVPLKYLASYLYITPQSLSRIRAGLREKEDVSK